MEHVVPSHFICSGHLGWISSFGTFDTVFDPQTGNVGILGTLHHLTWRSVAYSSDSLGSEVLKKESEQRLNGHDELRCVQVSPVSSNFSTSCSHFPMNIVAARIRKVGCNTLVQARFGQIVVGSNHQATTFWVSLPERE